VRLFLIALVSFSVGGCDLPSTPSQRVAEADASYSQIQMGMTSNEVYRLIGPCQTVDSNGWQHWRVVGMSTNIFAEMTVAFNANGRVAIFEAKSSLK
jgi:hypothetical protein